MRYAILALLSFAACTTTVGGGWSEGPTIDEEIRGVLGSGPGGRMTFAVENGVYSVPPSRLGAERARLVEALRVADAIRAWGPDREPGFEVFVDLREVDPGKVHFWEMPRTLEIEYPEDGILRVRRMLGEGEKPPLYLVELRDRRSGPDRDSTYRMWVRGSPGLEGAWRGVERALAREPVARRQAFVVPARLPGPGELGASFRWLDGTRG